MKTKLIFPLSALLAFVIPMIIVLSNIGYFLGFADAAEFALVIKIAGIAHAPGFPSYIIIGKLWSVIMHFLGIAHVKGLIWFSVFCAALSTLLLFFTCYRILKVMHPSFSEFLHCTISLSAALCFISGVTAWHWSGNVEVYAFQVLAFAITFFGFTRFYFDKNRLSLYITASGIALGLANHHLTMILFLPFLLYFFTNDLFKVTLAKPASNNVKPRKKEKITSVKEPSFIDIFRSKNFLILAGSTALLTAMFYGWMFYRASEDLPFKFGNPDNLPRFLYHLAGGAWIKNTQTKVEGLVGLRFPYFMNLTFEQIFLFIPLLFLGIIELIRNKSRKIIYICLGYYILILLYQLRIDQTADTDAYLLPAFFMLNVFILFGIAWLASKNKNLVFLIPVLFVMQVVLNFPKTDKRNYNVDQTLMHEIDRSAPKNSTVLIADWTTVIQYYYYRIVENFRPDLIVLNYDLKFTNYKIIPAVYPAFYNEIKPEYDNFITALGNAHPQEIYNTGCSLDTRELMNSFFVVIRKMQERCKNTGTPFMCDPKAYVFLSQYDLMSGNAIVSGCFVSGIPTNIGKEFLKLDYEWLDSPLILKEPSATDKMVDIEAALDFSKRYYKSIGDATDAEQAEKSYAKVKTIQREMKHNMPFVYRRP